MGLDAFTLSVESKEVNQLMGAVWLALVEELLTLLPYPDGENFFADRHAPDAALGTVLLGQEVLPIAPEFCCNENAIPLVWRIQEQACIEHCCETTM